jgi:phage terminase large subunit
LRSVCIREVQKSLKESSKRLLEDKLAHFRLGEADGFKVFREVIETPGDGVITFQGMQDHTAESIKSLEGFRRALIEEAQSLSARSLTLLRPTFRAGDSEVWAGWNPLRKSDPIDMLLRGTALPTGAVVVRANWSDNPWFPRVLEQERLDCLANDPEQYNHIWEGGYATVLVGAYYAKALELAKSQGRIGRIAADPVLPIKLFCDIGGTGKRSDAFTIWAVQFVAREIRVLNYYEAVGQPIGHHLHWLRENKYTPGNSEIILPHDGDNNEKVYDVTYRSAFEDAGYDAEVIPNQGTGAAKMRIEAARRLFPQIWFNADTTEPGRDALGWYHEKRDEARGIGLGPDHDWASHAADAFGLMCVAYEIPAEKRKVEHRGGGAGSWMG